MDAELAAARRAIFAGPTPRERASGLFAATANLRRRNFEQTAHALLDWPSAADDLGAVLVVALQIEANDMARAAIACLGHLGCVGVRLRDLDLLLDVAEAHPHLAPEVLQAIEDAAKSRNIRSKPCSFWALAGLPAPPALRSASGSRPSESSYLSLSWERWPFVREYSLWTMVRVAAFGSGAGEDKTTLLRAYAGNGARIHVWLEHKALHVTVQVRRGDAFTTTTTTKMHN